MNNRLYAYSAFGETLQAVGSAAADNPIRFASKWLDVESGLYDYNHRIYSPADGRFLSRDPIAENGGLNLYAYCGNDPVGHYDYLGMFSLSKLFKKVGKWFKKNWTSIVGAVLSYVCPPLGMAWSAAIGYKYGGVKGLALGIASSLIGAKIAGPVGNRIGNALHLAEGGLSRTVLNGYLRGGISGGINARLSGGNFWAGFRSGATTGAVLGVMDWTWENRYSFGRRRGEGAEVPAGAAARGEYVVVIYPTEFVRYETFGHIPRTPVSRIFGAISQATGDLSRLEHYMSVYQAAEANIATAAANVAHYRGKMHQAHLEFGEKVVLSMADAVGFKDVGYEFAKITMLDFSIDAFNAATADNTMAWIDAAVGGTASAGAWTALLLQSNADVAGAGRWAGRFGAIGAVYTAGTLARDFATFSSDWVGYRHSLAKSQASLGRWENARNWAMNGILEELGR